MSKVDNNNKSTNNISNSQDSRNTKASGEAFDNQLKELERMSDVAMARSVQLRTVTTHLNTIKKAADERVS